MKTKALIIISTLIALELLFFIVHQFVMGEPYINAYILIPVFFLLAEGAFVGMSSVKWTGKMANLWFFIHKTCKLLAAILLIGLVLFTLPNVGVAFFVRLLITYLIFLIIETIMGVHSTKQA
jgi:hypothetical protein